MRDFDGQTAVVTGASSGIGRAVSLALADCGAQVYVLGRREVALRTVALEYPGQISGVPVDIASEVSIGDFVKQFKQEAGRLDILVHCAGAFYMGPVEDSTLREFDELLRTNLIGPYLLTRNLLPELKKARGQVVFMNSTVGLQAKGGVAQYAASKHGLKALADSLRDEINGDGVRVLSVYPGRTASEMQERIHQHEGRAYDTAALMSPEDVAGTVLHTLGLSRSAEITDLTMRPMVKSAP